MTCLAYALGQFLGITAGFSPFGIAGTGFFFGPEKSKSVGVTNGFGAVFITTSLAPAAP